MPLREANELKETADNLILPEEWPPKAWKQSNENLVILEEYGEVLSDEYWDSWEKYSVEDAIKDYGSWVCSKKLKTRLQEIGYPITSHVEDVLAYVEKGTEIGCVGEGRLPTQKKNCPSAQVHGAKGPGPSPPKEQRNLFFMIWRCSTNFFHSSVYMRT